MIAVLLSVVFLAAATAKLADPWSLRLTVRELLPALPRRLAHDLALAVALLELAVALLFLAGPRALGVLAAGGTAVLAAAFAGAAVLARRRPAPVHCRCFGVLAPSTLSGGTVLTAVALLGGAALWLVTNPPLSTGPPWLRLLALAAVPGVLAGRRLATAPSRPRTEGARSW